MSRFLFNVVTWIKSEPVRVRLYTILALVAGYLLTKGYVHPEDYQFIVTVVASILGVEATRSKVSPVSAAADTNGRSE
jgi:hypothetical protein